MVSGRGLLHLLDPDGADGPRRFRAVGRQAARHHARDRRRPHGADRVSRRRGAEQPCRSSDGARRQSPGGMPEAELAHGHDARRVHDSGAWPHRPTDAAAQRHSRNGDHAPQLLRLPAASRRHPDAHQRRDGFDRHGPNDGVFARPQAGTRHAVRRRRRAGVRRADRRRALPRQRSGREYLPGKEADEHAGVGFRQERDPEAAASDESGAGARIHRGGRARRNHAELDPTAEAAPQGKRPQEGGAGRRAV